MCPKLVLGLALRTTPGRRIARKTAVGAAVTSVIALAALGAAGYVGYLWWEDRAHRRREEAVADALAVKAAAAEDRAAAAEARAARLSADLAAGTVGDTSDLGPDAHS
ncbi:MAG: hypothetical protein ACOYEV_10495 [Candidatus Nanopelagicales bacterium]